MKKTLLKSLVAILSVTQVWAGGDFDSISGDTTVGSKNPRTSTVDMVERSVNLILKRKCDQFKGCTLFVDEGDGHEFRVSAGAGVGNNPNMGRYGGGGIFIDNSNDGNEPYYGLSLTYTYSKSTCTRRVPVGVLSVIETYTQLMATPEYVNRVFNAWKQGEDLPIPENVKGAFSLLATLKPTQGNCGQNNNNNYRN